MIKERTIVAAGLAAFGFMGMWLAACAPAGQVERAGGPVDASPQQQTAAAVEAAAGPVLEAYTDTIPGTLVTFNMVPVPAGTVTIQTENGPQEVEVGPFWIRETEVTWDEFDVYAFLDTLEEVAGEYVIRPSKPYGAPDRGFGHRGYAALSMSYGVAATYAQWLSLKTGHTYRLPTEAEWEYASRGGLDLAPFPWGGPYVRNRQGCFLGNFKPLHGNYVDDGGFHTVPVDSYTPNDYGLYNMAGNVAEWTSTAFDESVYDFDHDLNPEYSYDALMNDPPSLKRKVIRGGSWKDIGYYMQTGTRSYEYQDTAKAYIGFRSVMTFLGRGKAVNAEDL